MKILCYNQQWYDLKKKDRKIMIGTMFNVCTILAGCAIGGTLKKGIREDCQGAMINAMGLAAVALGINTMAANMPKSEFPVLFIISLAIGSVVGTLLNIDGRFQSLANRNKKSKLGKGLSTAFLLFCIGTLSILGPIRSALYGDHTFLFTNGTLDFVTSIALAATYGYGMMLIAPVVFLWQGSIYLSAGFLQNFLQDSLMTEVSIIGGILIAASGLSVLQIKDCKTMNMLPSLLVPPVWFAVKMFAL